MVFTMAFLYNYSIAVRVTLQQTFPTENLIAHTQNNISIIRPVVRIILPTKLTEYIYQFPQYLDLIIK